jgi:hypothetical protein
MQNTPHNEIRIWSVCDVLDNISKQVTIYVAVFLCYCTETTSWRTGGKIECPRRLSEGKYILFTYLFTTRIRFIFFPHIILVNKTTLIFEFKQQAIT